MPDAAARRTNCHFSWAGDFVTADTLLLQTIYVLFLIELGIRWAHLAGCTANPAAVWATQQARQLSWPLQDGDLTSLLAT